MTRLEQFVSENRALYNGVVSSKKFESAYIEWLEQKLDKSEADLKALNSNYTICEECGSRDDILINKVCNNCYAEETISHIV